MVKVVFWLLDISYEVVEDSVEVRLWGNNDSGERVLVVDRNFVSYFYAVVEKDADVARVVEEIKNGNYPAIVNLEVADRRFFGRPVKAVKVYCKNPDDVPKYARVLRDLEGVKDCLEDDIRVSMRYMIDNDVVPCAWHEVEVVEETGLSDVQVDKVYVTKTTPKPIEKTEPPQLRILGFTMVCYSKEGTPKPERNPVVMISVVTDSGMEKQFVANEDRNDKAVLEPFIDWVREFDPDVIVGYGTNTRDWPYLIERCKRLGLRLYVDKTKTEPHTSIYGHVSTNGRASIDLADYAAEFPEVKVKSLENLADYLGIMKTEERVLIEDMELADYWDDRKKRGILKRFSMDNAHSVIGITRAVLDFGLQLSSLVGLPLDHVGTAAAGFRVEWFLIKLTHKVGELVPKRIERPYRPYTGAIVLNPKPGLHDGVADLDFKSMYPNIMIRYNLSPDTYVSPEEPEPASGVFEAPEVKHRFRKEPAGFYKEALSYLIGVRGEIRLRMKKLRSESLEFRVLNARQKAVKVITNAMYGYAGWIAARWYVKQVAEAATAWGRYTIRGAIEMAEKAGLQVVYGDTDSIFVKNDHEKAEKLLKDVEEKMGLEIGVDKVYLRIFFTEAKKRYAGLLPDGSLDIVGLEVMRGDWAIVAKRVQEKVLEIILKDQSPKKASEYVRSFISGLRQKHVAYRDLIIWKTLTKPPGEYEVKAAHVEAARMLKEKGWELSVGDKVGYVVVAGSGRLYERVKPYVFASYDEVDIEYYVSKQVVPAAARVLESFGITEEQLLAPRMESRDSKRLTDFF
jgi:DNA polymerase I